MSVRALRLVLALALGAGVLAVPGVATAWHTVVLRPAFMWSMEPRFGIDSDDDGLIDLPNTTEYVHNRQPDSCAGPCPAPAFTVHLDAGLTTATRRGTDVRLPVLQYRWVVSGGDLMVPLSYVRTTPEMSVRLAEGSYEVEMTALVRLEGGNVATRTSRRVVVDDLLVVAVGDSYASGDGNPEVRNGVLGEGPAWADAADHAAAADHVRARRSSLAWPVRTALAMERGSPHSSVTFVSVASSGATVSRGVLGRQGSAEPQLDQVADLVGDREIDVLLMSVGGNDVGFTPIVRGLVDADPQMDPICYDIDLENVWRAAEDGDWRRSSALAFDFTQPLFVKCRRIRRQGQVLAGLAGLPGELDRLAGALDTMSPGRVALMEYPDPTGGSPGPDSCDEIVGDATAPLRFHEIDRLEQAAGLERILGPLNLELAAAARRHDWILVEGVAEAFADGHGYCAPWPDYGYPDEFLARPSFMRKRLDHPDAWYRNPGLWSSPMLVGGDRVSWYRSAGQSAVLLGQSRLTTTGTMHPNELGHAALARLALEALRDSGE